MDTDRPVKVITDNDREPVPPLQWAYSGLFVRFTVLTLICSVIPLLFVGRFIYHRYSQFTQARLAECFQTIVDSNRQLIDLFLLERVSDLRGLTLSHSKENLQDNSSLEAAFKILNEDGQHFEDLGVINERGFHLAYVGPYDLMNYDYSDTFWFQELETKQVYVSDMFMGYRQVPHFIIAIKRFENGKSWILRSTLNHGYLNSLLENIQIGNTGRAYLLDEKGLYQTAPRIGGKLLEKAPLQMGLFIKDSGILTLDIKEDEPAGERPPSSRRYIIAYSWLKQPHWLLVVEQDISEVFKDVDDTNRRSQAFLALSAILILLVAVAITVYMIKFIRKRDEEADKFNKQLLQANKLASLGQLAAGVAHEINNPLAIIQCENDLMHAIGEDVPETCNGAKEQLFESVSQIDNQIQRCIHITNGLLSFSREIRSEYRMVDINASIREVIALEENWARANGIVFMTDLEHGLPPIYADPFQCGQILINLITNAIDAHNGKGHGTISVNTRKLDERNIRMIVSDTGSGIPPENIDRIFDPFFSTKPVGKGTGLGLPIVHSIARQYGGDISVKSTLGVGSEFVINLPVQTCAHGGQNEKTQNPVG